MDQYPTLNQSQSPLPPGAIVPSNTEIQPERPVEVFRQPLHFPGNDGGKSLIDMAERDLDATLQLLAERARYITGASGVAIALRQGDEMTCRASVGRSAPAVGTRLEVNAGLSGESVRTRQVLRCDDAQTDARVDQESCRELGISSALVMPLLRQQEVHGVFELLSSRAHAFEERDVTALHRLGEMIYTALDHAEAAKRAQNELTGNDISRERDQSPSHEGVTSGRSSVEASKEDVGAMLASQAESLQALLAEHGSVNNCEDCGFPVSGGRRLCLDCETSRPPSRDRSPEFATRETPADTSPVPVDLVEPEESWLYAHKYFLGTVLVAAVTVAIVVWLH